MTMDLESIEKIRQLKARYFRAIDTADQDLIRSCFAEDATVAFEGGNYVINLDGINEIAGFLHSAFHEKCATMHLGNHPEITVSGNSADGIWYLYDIFYDLHNGIVRNGTALYEDRYVQQSDNWVIQYSGYKRIWERMEKVSGDAGFTYRHLAEAGSKLAGKPKGVEMLTSEARGEK